MRMRRKKHLEERLENTKDFFIETDKNLTNVLEAVKDKRFVDFKAEFGNVNPVEMEIGCGKGGFITRLAGGNTNINYIAVELIQNIIVLAAENVKKANLKNVKFMNTGAEYLPRYIYENSLDKIYLNFSPPFPQKTNENRRLTNDRNVLNYKTFLWIILYLCKPVNSARFRLKYKASLRSAVNLLYFFLFSNINKKADILYQLLASLVLFIYCY
jgi:tRNA (guanine-N7-)-methyltransferase